MQELSVKNFLSLTLLSGLLVISACSDPKSSAEPGNDSINKIMPLGASRVEGARPYFESYRYELWKDLINNDWTFDFIGTRDDPASYPEVNGLEFDTDHEGRSGWTSGQILDRVEDWLEVTGSPDIVLFSSPGGNDALDGLYTYSEILSNINAIIDIIQEDNPEVVILIEQMAPGRSDFMTDEYSALFSQIQEDVATIAAEQTNSSSQVIAVDMYTGFADSMLADEIHYNEDGADFIANRYYEGVL
ncbi:SGNH/GDSL hydrolase family protein [Gracilimonas mengyeensis]|uniref:Lysophospholipase L1 n=1 Tax=Gracilimonas mengyeensis TaxID=1302730 RepID=A0A521D989_9BACT|nr:GDSL-type esterase/lipase family protein [Gracilimonas mengyeensis]SMO68162.1 Lysophospholipase L1 [Gracilimonas mengyeensis]